MTLSKFPGVVAEDPQAGWKEPRLERSCWASAAEDALAVVVPKHSVKQPIWNCVTVLVTCEAELGDGCVSRPVAD
jgi:hypothetical protein